MSSGPARVISDPNGNSPSASTAPPNSTDVSLVCRDMPQPAFFDLGQLGPVQTGTLTSSTTYTNWGYDIACLFWRVTVAHAGSNIIPNNVDLKLEELDPITGTVVRFREMNVDPGGTAQQGRVYFAGVKSTTIRVRQSITGPGASDPTADVAVETWLCGKSLNSQPEIDRPYYYAFFDRIAPAANKWMVGLSSGAPTRAIFLERVWAIVDQSTAVTGVTLEQQLVSWTSQSVVGTTVNIRLGDAKAAWNEDLNSVIASTGSTFSGTTLISRFFHTGEEDTISTDLLPGMLGGKRSAQLVYEHDPKLSPYEVPRLGVAIQNITSSTIGTCSYLVEFSLGHFGTI
jgi:hypothetical protein